MPAIAATALDALAREARRHPLLTAADEIELSRKVQRGMQPDSTPKEQRIGRRSRDRMINANLGLVLKNAYAFRKRIAGTILEIEDLAQAAIIGLNRAVDLFDSERGYKFSTYSTLWIRQALTKELAANRGTIKVSVDVQVIARRWRYRSADQTLGAFCEEFGYTR
jgi:RNA polymerase primary sigma factor